MITHVDLDYFINDSTAPSVSSQLPAWMSWMPVQTLFSTSFPLPCAPAA